LASAAYCSYLYPALQEFEITEEDYGRLAIRILFFYLAAMVVNRFVVESRRQTQRYQELAETLAEANRRLEQAQAEARRSERLAALGQLSAGLAHEIRNPLGVIKGSAEMLTQKLAASNPLATELAGYILTETNRLSALVTRFLDFARPLHADLSPRDIPSVLDRALNDVAQFWKGAPVRVEKQYQANLPEVPLDESLAEQAFVNIIQNAYDAMNTSGGVLRRLDATDFLIPERRQCATEELGLQDKIGIENGYEFARFLVCKLPQGVIDVARLRMLIVRPRNIANLAPFTEVAQPIAAPIIENKNTVVIVIL